MESSTDKVLNLNQMDDFAKDNFHKANSMVTALNHFQMGKNLKGCSEMVN